MIDIQVLDSNFELVGVIDTYDSFIWTERYNSCGDFELYSKFNQNILSTIKTEYYLSIPDSDRLMVVETIGLEHDYENGNIIKVQGRSIESLLDRRVIWDPLLIENVGLGSAIKTILTKSIINPDNVDRKVDGFIFSEPVPQVVEDIAIESTQLFGENLYEVITTLCQKYKVGYKLVLDENKHLVFSLYFGADRSYEQDTYPVVIFSSEFDNLLNSQYAESVVNYKNACLVLGEGDGNDKTKVEVKTPGAVYTGLNRREMCISESIGTDGETTTNDNYPLQLYQKGTDALSENKVESDYNGQIDPTRIYIFEQDYNLGDLVETVNDFNLSKKARVVEYIRSYASDGINYYPTFAYDEESEEETTYNVISFNVYNARKAVEDAERAADAALAAEDAAEDAAASALEAQGSASTAATAATNAQASAGNAQAAASAAQGSASNAAASASSASASAESANQSAINALTQLATIESVVNTLEWLTAHATLTDDTTVVADKNYYIRNQDGTFTRVADPTGNPHAQGWYELDEAITEYVASHLSLSDYGLDLVIDGNGYRIHIGTYTQGGDNGIYIINPQGKVVSFFGEEIKMGDNNSSHLNIYGNGIELKDYQDNSYMVVKDLRDPLTKEATFTQIFKPVGYLTEYIPLELFYTISDFEKVEVYVNNVIMLDGWTARNLDEHGHIKFTAGNIPDRNSEVKVIYPSNSELLKYFTFGSRDNTEITGGMSASFGINNKVEAPYSLAEGHNNIIQSEADYSHAEGANNVIGMYANCSHIEGSGNSIDWEAWNSHVEGVGNESIPGIDYVGGGHVEGAYSQPYNDSDLYFMSLTGIGSDENNKKNGYALTTDGEARFKKDVYVGCNDDSSGGRKLVSASAQSGSGTKSDVATGTTIKNLTTVSLPDAGVYMLIGLARFDSNSNGRRGLAWGSTTTGYFDNSLVVVPPVNGAITRIQSMSIVNVASAPYNVYLNCYHTAGTQLNVDYYWRYIKLA